MAGRELQSASAEAARDADHLAGLGDADLERESIRRMLTVEKREPAPQDVGDYLRDERYHRAVAETWRREEASS